MEELKGKLGVANRLTIKGIIMKNICIILFLLFTSQTIASDTTRVLTEREITFNNQLVLKLYLENNGARLIDKFSSVCSTFNETKGVIKKSLAEYRKSHALEYETMSDYFGKDSDTCKSAYEKWKRYQNFSWGACNMAKTTGDGKYINNCKKWSVKESSFFGYLEVLATKATDIINQNKLAKIEIDKNERLAKIEARKKALAGNKQISTKILNQQTNNCISELEEIYNLDKLMLKSINSALGSIEETLKTNLIKKAKQKLIAISLDKPLILAGDEFCQTLPDYKSKYDEINKEYSSINALFKSYEAKIQTAIAKRRQEELAQEKKVKLAQNKKAQSLRASNTTPSKKTYRKSDNSNKSNSPYIKEGSLFCSTKAQFDEQITWLAQGVMEFYSGCGASAVDIPVIVLDTSLFRGSAKVRGINNKSLYFIGIESLIYP